MSVRTYDTRLIFGIADHHPKATEHADDHEDGKAHLQLQLQLQLLDYSYSSQERSHIELFKKTTLTATWTDGTSTSTNSCRGVLAIVHMHHVGGRLDIRLRHVIAIFIFIQKKRC
jgi:hypothetical protein